MEYEKHLKEYDNMTTKQIYEKYKEEYDIRLPIYGKKWLISVIEEQKKKKKNKKNTEVKDG